MENGKWRMGYYDDGGDSSYDHNHILTHLYFLLTKTRVDLETLNEMLKNMWVAIMS